MRILLSLLMLGATILAYPQTAQQPFTLKLSAVKSQVSIGDQIEIRIVMTNTSDHPIDCTRTSSNGLDRNYRYDVSYEGQPAPKIIRKHPEIGEEFSTWPCIIKPGESASSAGGLISVLYDFNRPGEYTIQVERPAVFAPNNPYIKSNTITIAVLPQDTPLQQ